MTKAIKVKMFTKTVCPTCKIAKQQLSFLTVAVDIEEYNIETDKIFALNEEMSAHDYLTDVLDSMSTPTFLFEDGTVVRGFEVGPIMEKLGL
ncbi:glutaredoxin family protein [Bacillus cereus]